MGRHGTCLALTRTRTAAPAAPCWRPSGEWANGVRWTCIAVVTGGRNIVGSDGNWESTGPAFARWKILSSAICLAATTTGKQPVPSFGPEFRFSPLLAKATARRSASLYATFVEASRSPMCRSIGPPPKASLHATFVGASKLHRDPSQKAVRSASRPLGRCLLAKRLLSVRPAAPPAATNW